MKLRINTIIVDDKKKYADLIVDVIEKQNAVSTIAEFIPFPFKERTHFSDAEVCIRNNIKNKIPSDLVFSDYHLGGGKTGVQLFNLFNNTPYRPFKILHSNTTKRLDEHSEEFINGIYDLFSSTKTANQIENKLLEYENNILKIKLFGNPNYYDSNYKSLIDMKRKAGNVYKKYDLINVLSVCTNDDMHTITFREWNESTNNFEIKVEKPTGPTYRINNFMEYAEGLNFVRINQSVLINLLWIHKIDVISNSISFIMPNSLVNILTVDNFSSKLLPKNFEPGVISRNLHRHFQ